MEVLRFNSPAEFLDATKQFRSSDPVRTGLITSIANSVADGSRTYEECLWWAATDSGEIQGLAIRTLPYGYVLSPMPKDAVESLYSYISVEDAVANEFAGPKSVVDFLEKVAGKSAIEEESELIYENQNLISAPSVGEITLATQDDYDLIFSWMQSFMEITGLRSYNLENIVKSALQEERFYLLYVEGKPVSLGGHSAFQVFDGFSVGRVGPIYTPENFRKKGYASAITSQITALLISQGVLPTLYTQADNPTSNKIYQEIGYTLVDENRRVVFEMR